MLPTGLSPRAGYDGGDCCECACVSTIFHDCGVDGFSCLDPNSGCALVEAGTKTTITASANAYDVRPGAAYSNSGCMEDGCTPGLTRDGETDDTESRWSCIPSIVANGELCEIDFMFENPQDIVEVKVAFWKGDERTRTLEVREHSLQGKIPFSGSSTKLMSSPVVAFIKLVGFREENLKMKI